MGTTFKKAIIDVQAFKAIVPKIITNSIFFFTLLVLFFLADCSETHNYFIQLAPSNRC